MPTSSPYAEFYTIDIINNNVRNAIGFICSKYTLKIGSLFYGCNTEDNQLRPTGF